MVRTCILHEDERKDEKGQEKDEGDVILVLVILLHVTRPVNGSEVGRRRRRRRNMYVGSCQAIAYGHIKTRLLFLWGFLTPSQPHRSYQGKHLNSEKKKKKEEEAEMKKTKKKKKKKRAETTCH